MAPPQSLHETEAALLQTLQTLYTLPITLSSLSSTIPPAPQNSSAPPTDPITTSLAALQKQFQALHQLALNSSLDDVGVPREVIQYVEDGRNPDVYTREFVEVAVKQNQLLHGKMEAMKGFRDTLVEQVEAAFPELAVELGRIVEGTGGK